ncbi:replication-relaxation family protein [Streptomyces genisteinicus]|uniref:replication-relaxation family protein n=1 Tax=Streptomyces genisteinicus TaxID=2768068 RepID=UPI003CCCE8B4
MRVATTGQLRQLVLPGTADEQTVRNACKDLRDAELKESAGRTWRPGRTGTPVSQDLWSLTPAGQAAAATELERPVQELGATGRAAAQAGAAHQLAVTDVIDVIRQSPPLPTRPVPRRTAGPVPQRELPVRPRGIGHLRGWTTDVPLPGTGHLRADAVLVAPRGRRPSPVRGSRPPRRATRRRRREDHRLPRRVPPAHHGPARHDNAAPVVHPVARPQHRRASTSGPGVRQGRLPAGTRSPYRRHPRRLPRLLAAAGSRPGDSDTVPLVTTTLALLREHGPHGPVWTRSGAPQPLADALAHPSAPPAPRVPDQGHRPQDEQGEQASGQEQAAPSVWPCPSCGGATATGMPSGPGAYQPAPLGRCPRCEEVHRDLAQRRAQTGVLARLRSRTDSRPRPQGLLPAVRVGGSPCRYGVRG